MVPIKLAPLAFSFITLVLRRSKASLRLNILRRSLIFAARLCDTVATRLRFLDGLFDFLKWHQNFLVKFENFAKETFSSLTFWNTLFFPNSKMRRLDFLHRSFRCSLKCSRLQPRPPQPLKSKIHGRLRGRKSRIRVGSRAGDGDGEGVIGGGDPRIGGDGGVIRDVHLVVHQEHSNLFQYVENAIKSNLSLRFKLRIYLYLRQVYVDEYINNDTHKLRTIILNIHTYSLS